MFRGVLRGGFLFLFYGLGCGRLERLVRVFSWVAVGLERLFLFWFFYFVLLYCCVVSWRGGVWEFFRDLCLR